MPFQNYIQYGGTHAETAAVRNVLTNAGIMAPHTGQPYSEEFLLGLGGGLGADYFVFQYGDLTSLFIGTRCLWHQWDGAFIDRIVSRVGGSTHSIQSGAPGAAQKRLTTLLESGTPTCVWFDIGGAPYWGYGGYQYTPHMAVACGIDKDGAVELDDLAAQPWRVPMEQLTEARGMIRKLKNLILTIDPPTAPPDPERAVIGGIRDCIAEMRSARMKNFGLTAIGKWAELVAHPKDKKGWPQAFPLGPNLYRALYYTHHWIEIHTAGGGAFRTMYAGFLSEAAELLGRADLAEAARAYRELGRMWSALAATAFPDSVAPFKRAKDLARHKLALIRTGGPDAVQRIGTAETELRRLADLCGADFPLSAGDALKLLESMQVSITDIHRAEGAALELLESIVADTENVPQ